MSDPFELRLVFSNRLKALNPCEDNADEAVGFALKHRELAEDFHSCILEQLENDENNINVRANIVYFLEDLVELAKHERHFEYLCMIERDFPKIIDAAIPLDGLGIVNVNCVRYVLHMLHCDLGVFCTTANRDAHNLSLGQTSDTKTFEELEEYLDRRANEARPEVPEIDTDEESEPDMGWIDKAGSVSCDQNSNTPRERRRSVRVPTPPLQNSVDSAIDTSSRPYSAMSPVPPTPLSPSLQSLSSKEDRNYADGNLSTGSMKISPLYSPARVSVRETPTSAANVNSQPVTSPAAYTPVSKEDANIFSSQYIQLINQRMEQDRERQRRKEDNSGFIPVSDTMDAEIEEFAESSMEYGASLFEQMKAEARAREAALQYA